MTDRAYARTLRDMMESTGQQTDTPKSLRARLGLHQEELADRANVSARTMTEIDAGRDVRPSSIRRVSRVLGVTPGQLLDAMDRERVLRRSRSMFRARLHKRGQPLERHGRAGRAVTS